MIIDMTATATAAPTHGMYCERLDAAYENLRELGEDLNGYDDPKVQHEIAAQVADGFGCSCVAAPAVGAYADPYPGMKGSDRVFSACGRCDGTGLYNAPTGYRDRKGRPVCFWCNGSGGRQILVSSARATARNRAKAEAEAEAKRLAFVAARDAAEADFSAAHPAVWEWLNAKAEASSFAADLLRSVQGGKGLTDNQLAAVERIITRDAEHVASRRQLAEGRRVLTGTVVSVKEVFSDYGAAYKMTVELDGEGARAYGTVPGTIADAAYSAWRESLADDAYLGDYGPDCWTEALKGRRVTFTAKVERSERDESFGFYSRPTKAELLAP